MMVGVLQRMRTPVVAFLVLATLAGVTGAGEAEEIAALRAIEERLPQIGWPQAHRELKAFDKANPALGPESQGERRRVGDVVATARGPYFRAFVGRRLEPIVRERIRLRVEAGDSTHSLEVAWLAKSAASECLAALRREVRDKDPAATDEEVTRFWAERPGRQGAFRSIPWPRDRSREDGRTWRATPIDGRVTYLFGRFLLAKAFFEVSSGPDDAPCRRCEGDGTITFTLPNGAALIVLCPECDGHGHPTRLRYR